MRQHQSAVCPIHLCCKLCWPHLLCSTWLAGLHLYTYYNYIYTTRSQRLQWAALKDKSDSTAGTCSHQLQWAALRGRSDSMAGLTLPKECQQRWERWSSLWCPWTSMPAPAENYLVHTVQLLQNVTPRDYTHCQRETCTALLVPMPIRSKQDCLDCVLCFPGCTEGLNIAQACVCLSCIQQVL